MSTFDVALARWRSVAPLVLSKVAALVEFAEWQCGIEEPDRIALRLHGPRYELVLFIRVVDLLSDGRLAIQTALVCDNLLARRLSDDLRLTECWPTGFHYRLGTVALYLEWLASNNATPPRFEPTHWSEDVRDDDLAVWRQNLVCVTPLINAVQRGEPVFPVLEDIVNVPRRIQGSSPVWGSQFDRAVASLDIYMPNEVAAQAEQASSAEGVLDNVACELKRLVRWLSSAAPLREA